IARSLDCAHRTIQRRRKILLDLKTIIEATRTGHGFIYTVLLYSKKKDLPLETPRRERQERTNLPTLPDNSGEVRSDKTVHQIGQDGDRKSTRLNSSHLVISYAVFCLKKKNKNKTQ